MQRGRVMQWRVRGPDGNFDYLESLNFVQTQRASKLSCGGIACADLGTHIFTAPWSTPLTPAKIALKIAGKSHKSQPPFFFPSCPIPSRPLIKRLFCCIFVEQS